MSATKNPNVTPPTAAPTVTREFIVGMGETESHEWSGERGDVAALYDIRKAEAEAGTGNIEALLYRSQNGRATLIARFGRSNTSYQGVPSDVTIIEELYSIDVIVPIYEAPYFSALTDEQVAFVRECAEEALTTSAEINAYVASTGKATGLEYGNWTEKMKELAYHLARNATEFRKFEFILRQSYYGVRTSVVQASFANINEVVTAPTFKTQMSTLVGSLPSGEWLYRPPQAEHLGKGRWRITKEWQWALQWSVAYGGTWGDL